MCLDGQSLLQPEVSALSLPWALTHPADLILQPRKPSQLQGCRWHRLVWGLEPGTVWDARGQRSGVSSIQHLPPTHSHCRHSGQAATEHSVGHGQAARVKVLSVTQTRFGADLGKGSSALPAGVSRLLLTEGNASVRTVSAALPFPSARGILSSFSFSRGKASEQPPSRTQTAEY